MEYLHNFEGFVNESYNSETELNEAFKSSILKGLAKNKDLKKSFFDALSIAGIPASEISDDQIFQVTPAEANKATRKDNRKIFLYYSDGQKENPYADSNAYDSLKSVPADTLLAVVRGGKYQMLDYDQFGSRKKGKAVFRMVSGLDSDLGVSKSRSGYGSSGLSSLKRMADVADRVFVIDPDRVPFDSTELASSRSAARSGATAFLSDKDFKKANRDRYEQILQDSASKLPIAKLVGDAIDELTTQIKDAIASDKKDKHGRILIGLNPKGREVNMNDAANLMSGILDSFSRYADYTKRAEEETSRYGKEGGSFYEREAKSYAKHIKDKIEKISSLNYAW